MIRDSHPDQAAISAATTQLQLTLAAALSTALAAPDLPGAVKMVQEAIAQHWENMLPEAVRDALLSLAVAAYFNGYVSIPDEVIGDEDPGAGSMLAVVQGTDDLARKMAWEFAGSCAFHDGDADVMRSLAVLAVLSDDRRTKAEGDQ